MKGLIYALLLLLLLPLGCGENNSSRTGAGEKASDAPAAKSGETILPPVGMPESGDAKEGGGGESAPSPMPPMAPVFGDVAGDLSIAPAPGMAREALPRGDMGEAASLDGWQPGNGVASDLLTAGSFDDSLNLDIFSEYFNESRLSSAGINQLEQPNWNELIPKREEQNYDTLDLTFAIDVTGSMGDELSYIKAEIDSIASELSEKFPSIKQRFGMIAYRDKEDSFVTKKYDFTENLEDFKDFLNQQTANEGGDYPEAMDQALSLANTLQWGNNKSAKILFLIADAPPHDADIKNTFDAVFALKDKGVHIYPIAASGVLDLAESVMRTSALLTGGQYLFLTDDSGIGNEHAEPKFPCYYIEKLKDVMVRVIADELSGQRSEPDAEKLIRTVGNPVKGVCAPRQ